MATDWSQVWGHLHILHTCAAAALPVVMAIPHNTRKRSAPFLKRGYKTILAVCMHAYCTVSCSQALPKEALFAGFFYMDTVQQW